MRLRPIKPPYRLLLVDDHKFVCEMLAHKLAADRSIDIVGIANHGAAALAIAREQAIDIVLLDMQLEQEDGIAIARQLLETRPGVRIIGLSVHDQNHYPLALLELGGVGFLSKRTSAREIGDAVRRVAAGEMAVSTEIAVFLATQVGGSPLERLKRLTTKESEVLELVASGLSVKEIAQRLGLTAKTVQSHRNSLRKKLGAQTDVELCLIALRSGLVDIHRPAPEVDAPAEPRPRDECGRGADSGVKG
jgi:two-component system invasion response regulator UvrY